jgi:hypothetical protein
MFHFAWTEDGETRVPEESRVRSTGDPDDIVRANLDFEKSISQRDDESIVHPRNVRP